MQFRIELRISLFLCAFFFISSKTVICQRLDNIKENDPLTVRGSVSTNQVISNQYITDSSGISYHSYYSGNLNLKVYGFSIPLTFIYTDQKSRFSHPFNQLSIHPSYKDFKAHVGQISMSFSPYTLNGHLFKGAGTEYTFHGKFRLKMMGGELKRAVLPDSANPYKVPSYQRFGYGINLGYSSNSDAIDIIVFRAFDKVHPDKDTYADIAPKENSVVSVSFKKSLINRFTFTGEFANSIMTEDITSPDDQGTINQLNPAGWFYNERASTSAQTALKTSINYNWNQFNTGVSYEYIDPEYSTLGTYYFTNNLENYTLQFSGPLVKETLNLSVHGGIQKNNPDQNSQTSGGRFAGSGNLSFTPADEINVSLGYSNFTSFTNTRSTFDYINQTDPYQNSDTLNYRQISQNVNLNGNYQFGNQDDFRQSANMSINYQTSDDNGSDTVSTNSRFYNINLIYILTNVPANFNISISCNFNRNEVSHSPGSTYGPGVTVSKMFFDKKLRTTGTVSYNRSDFGLMNQSSIINLRYGMSYSLKKQHHINTNFLYQHRNSNVKSNYNALKNITSFTLSYNYTFDVLGRDKKEK